MASATVQGQLWGTLARDWAMYGEQICLPLHGAALDAAHVTAGTRLLDAGCGAGLLTLLASLRGARVSAIDAAADLLDVVRERVPSADVRDGDLEALPFADASFDAVTAVNSIFYAMDMNAAMRELARVVRPGGRVVITAWGPPERSEVLADLFSKVAPLMPPPPPGSAPAHPGALSQPGELAAVLKRAGLHVVDEGEVACPVVFPSAESRGAPIAALARISWQSHTVERLRSARSSPTWIARTRGRMGRSGTRMCFSGRRAGRCSVRTVPFLRGAKFHDNDDCRPTRTQAFAEQALGIVNSGFLSLMLSVGHRTGLFDTMVGLEPRTSAEIAAAAGLHERYVREWLGAMVTGRIVEYDPATERYWLPREHAAALTRAAGPDNLAELAQVVAMLGQVESAIVDVFRKGGGVDYRAFERFHALMAESSHTTLEATLLTRTLPLVPGLVDRLEAGIDVLDMGCGEGVAIRMMAQRFPHSRFDGVDIAAEAITTARAEAKAANLTNTQFHAQDAATFSAPAAFDFITAFDAIHDQAAPRRVLRAIHEALRPGGVFLMVDIAASTRLEGNLDNPLAPFLFTVSAMHCMTVSLAQGGEGLGACWGEEKARELLAEVGFTSVEVSRVEGDPLNAYYVCRP